MISYISTYQQHEVDIFLVLSEISWPLLDRLPWNLLQIFTRINSNNLWSPDISSSATSKTNISLILTSNHVCGSQATHPNECCECIGITLLDLNQNLSITTGWIDRNFYTYIYVPLRMNYDNFSDPFLICGFWQSTCHSHTLLPTQCNTRNNVAYTLKSPLCTKMEFPPGQTLLSKNVSTYR